MIEVYYPKIFKQIAREIIKMNDRELFKILVKKVIFP